MSKQGIETAVVGFGKTGKGVLDFFMQRCKLEKLYLYNDTPIEDSEEQRKYEAGGVTFLIGGSNFDRLSEVETVVISPGVNGKAPRFDRLREKGVKIIAEIELGYSSIDAPVIAVTGTNGKSTTVSLIHHILIHSGVNSYLAGNIGTPLVWETDKISEKENPVVVLEVSSFQLEEIVHFKPHIGIILNVTPDHLDRYTGMENYFAAKLNIVKNQDIHDFLVLNRDDRLLRENEQKKPGSYGSARKIWFSVNGHGEGVNVWVDGNFVYFRQEDWGEGERVEKISIQSNPLRGLHNLENIMASIAAARLIGVNIHDIEKSIAHFKGLSHRMESVGKIGNVEFINDSKATNVDAALKSISSIPGPILVILGGKDKGGDFRMLSRPIAERVDKVLLLGKAAKTIRSQLEMDGLMEKLIDITDFDDAVEKGLHLLGEKGGVVLLAPGCASFDMFKNFEHRGDVFREAVSNYKVYKEKR